jgi:hypothetical protein
MPTAVIDSPKTDASATDGAEVVPIMAYEILARKGGLAPRQAQANARYLEGFAPYQARRWEEALPAFRDALQLDPSDGPSRYYQERCETLLAAPPEMIHLEIRH